MTRRRPYEAEAMALTDYEIERAATVNRVDNPLRRWRSPGGTWWWIGIGGWIDGRIPVWVKTWAPDQEHPGRRPRPDR